MTDTTKEWLSKIPSLDEPAGEGASVSAVQTAHTRRRFLQTTLGLGGALALTVIGGVPGFRVRGASATPGTEHLDCAGYGSWSGYNDNSQECVGGTYSSFYCGTDKWFKNYSTSTTTYFPVEACGNGVTQKNAWRWTHSFTPYRCADGYMCSSSSCVFRICSAANP